MATNAKPKLVLDTNTFIKCLSLQDLNEKYELYTTPEVLAEIRDKRARDKFAALSFEIKTTWPSDSSIKFVKTFATKTGDITSLSETDIDLMALAFTFAEKNKKTNLLRKEPPALTEYVGKGKNMETEEVQEVIAHFESQSNQNAVQEAINERMQEEIEPHTQSEKVNPEEMEINNGKGEQALEESKLSEPNESSEKIEKPVKKEGAGIANEKGAQEVEEEMTNEIENERENKNTDKKADEEEVNADEDDDDDDDDEGWINLVNINRHLRNAKEEEKDEKNEIGVALMTSDFAMQNVLLQIGIPILSFDGLFIKQTKKFVLKCLGCKRITKQTNKEFCPTCGNHTLTKVTCSINADGTVVYYLKKNYKANTRGCIYPIPKKQGGRAQDLLLREDEFKLGGREYQRRKDERDKKKKWDSAMYDYDAGMGFNIKQPSHGNKAEFGYGRKNPNDPNAFKTIRNKK